MQRNKRKTDFYLVKGIICQINTVIFLFLVFLSFLFRKNNKRYRKITNSLHKISYFARLLYEQCIKLTFNMKKILLSVIATVLISQTIFSQSAKKAEKLLLTGNIPEAIKAYEKLVEKDPDKGEYHMYLGECYLRTPQIHGLAIPALQKAVAIFEKKHKNEAFVNAKFLLGKAYHVNYLFDEAIQVYNELVIDKEYKSADILENEIRACEAAKKEFKKKKLLKVVSPGDGINTELTQHSPFLIEDKGIFIYTSKEKTANVELTQY